MDRSTRVAWYAILVSCTGLALMLQGCEPSDEDYDILAPLESSGHALSSSGYGASGPTTSTADGSRTEVWAATLDWSDTTSSRAREAGPGWEANSGLNWEQKYQAWIDGMRETQAHSGSRTTAIVTTPYGKELPIPYLECAELGMTLRVLFASWYGLPFYLEARDSSGTRIYFGHFGARTKTGRYRNTPEFRTRYEDYTGLSSSDIANNWPSDGTLRGRHLYGGGSDNNLFLGEEAGAGYYFDELLLNKRTGYFLLMLLPYFGSVNLADDANLYHVQAEGVRAGDILLKRWQKRGIGHVIVVKQVDELPAERLSVEVFSGSMPRRQGVWESPAAAKMSFTNKYTGGEGENHDGDAYVDLGGGLKRFLAPQRHGGAWRQHVLATDRDEYIRWSDKTTRAARPARFEQLLGEPSPEALRDELLDIIEAKRDHLRRYPASCSAREGREQAFEQLYEVMQEKFGMSRDQVDEEYRILDDYVFAELVYNQSKTCCWNSTTSDMYEIIMDLANAEAQDPSCSEPSVFMAQDGGYSLWSDHAQSLGRGGEWVAWSPDETCPQAGVTNDTEKVHGWTPWCEITDDPADPTIPDPFEPNNNASQAFVLGPGSYAGAAISEGDADWFTFTPPTGAVVRFEIDFAHADGDLDVRMYRGDQEVDSGTSSSDGEVVDSVHEGSEPIYVEIFGYSGAVNSYSIEVVFEGGQDLGAACSNSDDSMATALELGVGTYHGLAICSSDSVDWIRIPATAGSGTATIEFAGGFLGMELYRSNGTLLATGQGSGNVLTVDTPPGLRFLKVFGSSSSSIEYTLTISD